jgi:hypothetical protein
MPLVWFSSSRIVIRLPYGKSPGSQRSTVSSSPSLCSVASFASTVAVQSLLTLSRRSRASGRMPTCFVTFAQPALPLHVPCGPDTNAVTPGASRCGPLTSPSSVRWWSGRGH